MFLIDTSYNCCSSKFCIRESCCVHHKFYKRHDMHTYVCMFASRKYMYLSVKVFSSNTEHLYSDLVDMYACMHRGEISENHKEEIST